MVDKLVKLVTGSLYECNASITPQEVPKVGDFFHRISPSFVLALSIASVLSMATLALGIIHLMYIVFYVTHVYRRAFIFYLAGTAPFVSMFALTSMYIPRVGYLAHLLSFLIQSQAKIAIIHFQLLSIALYVIICLLLHIVQGRQSIVKKTQTSANRTSVQTPPFCCVCPCLPQLPMEARRIRFFELMVLQTPCARLVATIVSLVLYDASLTALKVLDFVFLPTLLIGIYGCHILVTTVSKLDELCPYRYIAFYLFILPWVHIVVFRLLDIYFMLFGLQQHIFDILAKLGVFNCNSTLPVIDTALWVFESLEEFFHCVRVLLRIAHPHRAAETKSKCSIRQVPLLSVCFFGHHRGEYNLEQLQTMDTSPVTFAQVDSPPCQRWHPRHDILSYVSIQCPFSSPSVFEAL